MTKTQKRILTLPYMVWAGLFIILPILLVIYYSFSVTVEGRMVFSFDNYRRLFDPIYMTVLLRSVTLALSCTLVCIAIGYPVAYILASKDYITKGFLLFLFLVPMWMNYLLRTYAWVSILERNGFINKILDTIGLPKLDLLYTNSAVLLGMVITFCLL